MKWNTPSKVIVSFRNIDAANGFVKALKTWSRMAGGGGDSAILFGEGYKGVGSEERGTVCGVVGHDVSIEDITHDIPDEQKESMSDLIK